MGTTSSFFGGSGGGGDPTGKFQAAATVAEGDLVVLNDNGTVQPVTSTAIAANFGLTNNGNKLYASSAGNNYSGPHSWPVHNATRGYLFVTNEGGGNIYHRIKYGSYNSGTGQYSLTTGNVVSGYAGWLSQLGSPSDGYLYYYGGNSGASYVRGIRWTGSAYTWTSQVAMNDSNTSNVYTPYISASGEGSNSYVAVNVRSDQYLAATHGTWDGSSSTPTRTTDMGSNNARWTTGGASWGTGWIAGSHVKNDVHVIAVNNTSNIVKLVAIDCKASGTTFGTVLDTNITQQSGYAPSMAYDPVENIGIIAFKQGGGVKLHGFTVNITTLAITFFGVLSTTVDNSNAAALGFNPTAKKFVACGQLPLDGPIKIFEYTSGGNEGSATSFALQPGGTNLYPEEMGLAPVKNSGNMILTFKSATNPTSNYIDASNHIYVTQFGMPYTDTNIDKHFGEAKEAISTNAAGSVAILDRSIDIADSGFQKGQKLFANPSGTALATSGTYRVGHATDGDSVLVLGDPS